MIKEIFILIVGIFIGVIAFYFFSVNTNIPLNNSLANTSSTSINHYVLTPQQVHHIYGNEVSLEFDNLTTDGTKLPFLFLTANKVQLARDIRYRTNNSTGFEELIVQTPEANMAYLKLYSSYASAYNLSNIRNESIFNSAYINNFQYTIVPLLPDGSIFDGFGQTGNFLIRVLCGGQMCRQQMNETMKAIATGIS